jgi:polyhydroxyalkanoate synthesis regulator phasin
MDDFVEVHKTASQSVDVGLVLADVKITLQASEKKYKEFLQAFLLSCENAKAKVNNFVKTLQNARDEAKNHISNTWNHQLEKGKKGIKDSQTNLASTKARLEATHKQMTQIIIDYHSGVSETDNKLHVVKELRDIIEDELINPGKSFIQVDKFNEKLKNLESLIKKSGDSLYAPIIETLVQLASQQNFSDQKILHAILKNLKELETSLQKFKTEREHDMNVGLKNLRAQEENLTSQLADYLHLEQKYYSDVAEANQNIEILNAELLNLNNEITRKTEELHNLVHLCDTENDMFKAGTQRMELIKKDLSQASNHAINLKK